MKAKSKKNSKTQHSDKVRSTLSIGSDNLNIARSLSKRQHQASIEAVSLTRYNSLSGIVRRSVDLLVVAASTIVSYGVLNSDSTSWVFLAAFIACLLVALVFPRFELYLSWRGGSFFSKSLRICNAWLTVTCLSLMSAYLMGGLHSFSRSSFVFWALVTPVLLVATDFFFAVILAEARTRGLNIRKAICIGGSSSGLELSSNLNRSPDLGLHVQGYFADEQNPLQNYKLPFLGNLSKVEQYITQNSIDTVYIALPAKELFKTEELLKRLRSTTAAIYIVPDLHAQDYLRSPIQEVAGFPVLAYRETPVREINSLIKSIFDFSLASLGVLALSPILIFAAIGIKLTSEGPILFKQKRYGYDGKVFWVYKFRTMTVCESDRQVVQTQRNDSRVTPFGDFMRRTSIDELPQLFNVLEGSMSMIGPRPHALPNDERYREFEGISEEYLFRYKVKPGITGWAQVNGFRGEDTPELIKERIRYDLEYVKNWSFMLDCKIVYLTIKHLLFTALRFNSQEHVF